MKTIKGVARATVSTPSSLAWTAVGITGSVLLCGFVALSDYVWDKALCLMLLLFFSLVFYLQPSWSLFFLEGMNGEVVWRMPNTQNFAALTIDDVPLLEEPTNFESILDVLAVNNVKATLFIMSGFDCSPSEGGPDPATREYCRYLLQRAVNEGHELANHMQFNSPAIAMSPEEFDKAFIHCHNVIAELSGGQEAFHDRPRRWFRPASALWTPHILEMARRYGYTTVIGNCFAHDHAEASRFLNPLYYSRRAKSGSILIVHDRWHSPSTLAQALPRIAKRGIRLCTLSQLKVIADADRAMSIEVELAQRRGPWS